MNSTGPTEFVTLSAAAAQVGVSRTTMRDRVRLGMLPAYRDPLDRRLVLLRAVDVERLRTPRPVAAPREEVAAVA